MNSRGLVFAYLEAIVGFKEKKTDAWCVREQVGEAEGLLAHAAIYVRCAVCTLQMRCNVRFDACGLVCSADCLFFEAAKMALAPTHLANMQPRTNQAQETTRVWKALYSRVLENFFGCLAESSREETFLPSGYAPRVSEFLRFIVRLV